MSPYRSGPLGSRARCDELARENAALERRILPAIYTLLDLGERDELARAKAATSARARTQAELASLEERLVRYAELLVAYGERAEERRVLRETPPDELAEPAHEPPPERAGARIELPREVVAARRRAYRQAVNVLDPAARVEAGEGLEARARFRRKGAPFALASVLDSRTARERHERPSDATHVLRTSVPPSHPTVRLAPETEWTRLGRALGLGDPEVELDDASFDAAFVVRAPEPDLGRVRAALPEEARARLVELAPRVLFVRLEAPLVDLALAGTLEAADLAAAASALLAIRDARTLRLGRAPAWPPPAT